VVLIASAKSTDLFGFASLKSFDNFVLIFLTSNCSPIIPVDDIKKLFLGRPETFAA